MKHAGFTTQDPTIVIAIIAILLAVAVPAYFDHRIRAKVVSAIDQARPVFLVVDRYYRSTGSPPNSNNDAKLTTTLTTELTSGITVGEAGTITIQFSDQAGKAAESSLTLRPEFAENGLVWHCEGNLDKKFWPADCRSGAMTIATSQQ